MKSTITIIILLFSVQKTAFSQAVYGSYVDGSPAIIVNNTDIEGTELLNDQWLLATVKSSKDINYQDLKVKYNVVQDKLFFLGNDEQTMSFTAPIKEFKLLKNESNTTERLFRNNYPSINGFNTSSYYEVLADGKAAFLKKLSKKIGENRTYNAATKKKITDFIDYYLFVNGQMMPISKDKTFFQSAFPDKQNEVTTYIANNKLNTKKEEDIKKIIEYYNSL